MPVLLVLPVTPNMRDGVVKKSVSIPRELWEWAEKESQKQGHGMTSRVIAEAVKTLRKACRRRKEFAK